MQSILKGWTFPQPRVKTVKETQATSNLWLTMEMIVMAIFIRGRRQPWKG